MPRRDLGHTWASMAAARQMPGSAPIRPVLHSQCIPPTTEGFEVHRASRLVTVLIVILMVTTMFAGSASTGRSAARAQQGRTEITVRGRLIGWVARRDGYHLYREGATVRLAVVVWPHLPGEAVRARLEWRRPGRRWRLLDVSSTRLNLDGRGLFLVRRLPDGYSFRIRARVPAGDGHRAGHSRWRFFRVL